MSASENSEDKVTLLAGSRAAYELGASILLVFVFVVGLFVAQGFPRSASMFPTFICWLGIGVAVVNAGMSIWKLSRREAEASEGVSTSDLAGDRSLGEVFPYLVWIVGTYVGSWLFGFIAAATVFCIAFLFLVARLRPIGVVAMTCLSIGVVLTLGLVLNVSWPTGIIWQLLF